MDDILKSLLGPILKHGGPALAGAVAGPAAGRVAQSVADAVAPLLGLDDAAQIPAAVASNPAAVGAAIERVAADPARVEAIVTEAAEETRRLAEVNATMRAELTNGDCIQRWWRPAVGYVFALANLVLVVGFGFAMWDAIFRDDRRVFELLLNNAGNIGLLFSPMMLATGIAAWTRGAEKQAASLAGAVPQLIEAVRAATTTGRR